jgi:hypothetical protein
MWKNEPLRMKNHLSGIAITSEYFMQLHSPPFCLGSTLAKVAYFMDIHHCSLFYDIGISGFFSFYKFVLSSYWRY